MAKELILPEGTDVNKILIAPGVRANGFVYVSGSAGMKDGKVVSADVEEQARQAMENLGKVLKAAGLSWEDVVKVNCFLTNPKENFPAWNKVFKEYFPKNPPARTTVGAEIGAEGAMIEVELIAVEK